MLLLTTEIDLNSFFDVNLVIFTTIAFLFSVLAISFLVFGLIPINKKAKLAKKQEPEKLNIVYLRLIIYILAEFIAFVSDMFLVIFGSNYKLPWATTIVFLTITFYKLVFVLFRDFKDLGFNAKGITETIKTASKVVIHKNLDSVTELLDKQDEVEDETKDETKNENKQEDMKKRVKYKNKSLRSKFSVFFTFLLAIPFLNVLINYDQQQERKEFTTLVWEIDNNLNTSEDLNIYDYFNQNKFVASGIIKWEFNKDEVPHLILIHEGDTIIIKK